ncbi:unnamed protein product [Fraxinus pennsylvanica]|uniref:Uncharacterized protein n=1 Tax=Fraxinus pennsylvanica TaxID=56036 RepID=A0AAD2E0W1_9LAMI|nr:unnamed protein product [Fraxinus pennsylvanica]
MAANLQRLGLAKRFLPSLCLRRGVHVSVYDKNIEEHVHSTVVPDYLILPQSDKYWAPHPQTGVFGPATDHKPVYHSPISRLFSTLRLPPGFRLRKIIAKIHRDLEAMAQEAGMFTVPQTIGSVYTTFTP